MTVNKNEFFREITLRICSSLDIDQALSQVFSYINRYLPADMIGLGYSDLNASRINVVAKVAREGFRYPWKDGVSEIVLSQQGIELVQARAIDNAPATIINRPDGQPQAMLDLFPGFESCSTLFLRLNIRGEEFGALMVSAEGLDRYSPKDAALIESVREPFSIAMVNARRYGELAQMRDRLAEDNDALFTDIKRSVGLDVIGADFGLRDIMEQVRQIAQSNSPTLILGETGTGKEVIANAIHMASRRRNGPLISMQCGAIPETLLDSELFGHEKGAFTGALGSKRGRFERAQGGTLFLDEIGELSLEAQVRLLRVLQERRFERVGGTKAIEIDVRVIAATHRDLETMVREGKFREDLWYRLNVLPIRIPPLRLRRDDIPSLIQYFIQRKAQEMNLTHIPWVSSHDLERLKAYRWPGNVREVQNIVERALILSQGDRLRFPDLGLSSAPIASQASNSTSDTWLTLDEAMASHIRRVLEHVDWQVAGKGGAAEILNMNPSTLRFRMKKLGIARK